MGTLGIFASRFDVNTKTLEAYDEALRFIKKKEEIEKTPEVKANIDKILDVIEPILKNIEGNLSDSIAISDRSVLEIMKDRNEGEWPTYKMKLQHLYSKLTSNRFRLSKDDFRLLDDIADALDVECGNLFRRMSESR